MNLNEFSFINAAKNIKNLSFTDEELLECLYVHQCLLSYFINRKESIIASGLAVETNILECFAKARLWKYDWEKHEWEVPAVLKQS